MAAGEAVRELFWKLDQGVARRAEAFVQRFATATQDFIAQLLMSGLPSDWHERLAAHLEFWQQEGSGVAVMNRPVLEQYIVTLAHANGLGGPAAPHASAPAKLAAAPTNSKTQISEQELSRMAHQFAVQERRRLSLTEQEYAEFEAFLLRNIRRHFRGEALDPEPAFWFDKDRRWRESQRHLPPMRGISPEQFDRNELEYKRRNLDKLPPDERQRVDEQIRWEERARYVEAEGGGLLAHLKAFLNPAFDGMGTVNDAAIIASGFTGVPGFWPRGPIPGAVGRSGNRLRNEQRAPFDPKSPPTGDSTRGTSTPPSNSSTNTLLSTVRRYWVKSVKFQGTKVYQRDEWIDPLRTDSNGVTSLDRMKVGKAPIGPDGKPISLHHLLQTEEGALAEITAQFHSENSRIIHINPTSIPTGIDRVAFRDFRENYWMNRAADFSGN